MVLLPPRRWKNNCCYIVVGGGITVKVMAIIYQGFLARIEVLWNLRNR